jgi:F0F1-type ATP synthase membrane subunit c/vacuolar-type H+-ATPase subunit K|uniref:Uncharacterized protein n=1 Tax=Desulfobacca acetoxidans TaxID=60893 RepID=A0A7C3WGW8_9BACT
MTEQPSADLKKRYLAVNLIGLAMIGSVFLYALVVEVLRRLLAPFAGFGALSPEATGLLTYLFFFLTLGIYFVIRVIRQKLPARSPQLLPQIAILTFALCEAVAIFGFVLFLLSGNALDFYLFFAISLFMFYIFYPKYESWEKILAAHTKDDL